MFEKELRSLVAGAKWVLVGRMAAQIHEGRREEGVTWGLEGPLKGLAFILNVIWKWHRICSASGEEAVAVTAH